MKTKITTLFLGMFCMLRVGAQTQVVDLSTGVVNNSTTLIAVNSNDDTWQVAPPASSTYSAVKCTNGCLINGTTTYCSTWAGDSHVRWLSPNIDASGYGTNTGLGGNYTYRTTFTALSCAPTSATITLNKYGADDTFTAIVVNGHSHALSASFNPLLPSSGSTTINVGSEIIAGTNTITVTVNNQADSYTGLLIYGNLTINYPADPNLVPAISGASSFCYGDALTFTGSDGPATASNHYWEICESNSAGVPVTGGYTWSSWYTGVPGSFTFPVTPACGKYYRVKLAVQNACNGWAETTTVIYINCLPTANAGPDVTICAGSCITIGTSAVTGCTYQWTTTVGSSSVIVGTTAQIYVCPRNTTVYSLIVTNSVGCIAFDNITVTIENNNPSFGLSSNLNPSDNFYTLFATPTISTLPTGAGFAWFVDEIVSTTNTTVISGSSASNPSCWWSPLTCNFNGYDGPLFTTSGNVTNPMTGGCGNPSVGHFTVGHTYRIIRGTWSPVCPWQQYASIIYMTHSMAGDNIHYMEDVNAPDYSSFITGASAIESMAANDLLTVYPNPGTGLFTITSVTASGSIEVYDVLGNKVKSIELKNNASDYKLDLSGYSKGMYLLNMISDGKRYSKKIILE
jgi:hypothetical protein